MREFDLRALKGTYELAMLSPQAARLAQTEAGYVPLLRVTDDLCGVLLVPKDSVFQSPRDLAGHRIALPDRFTTTAQLGKELLAAAGLNGDDILHPPGFQDSILLSMLRGDIDAMVMNSSAFHQMAPETKARVRVLAETRRISHVMFLARGDMAADTAARHPRWPSSSSSRPRRGQAVFAADRAHRRSSPHGRRAEGAGPLRAGAPAPARRDACPEALRG